MAGARLLIFGQDDALRAPWILSFKSQLQKASISFAECSVPQNINQFRDCAWAVFVNAGSVPLAASRWKAEFVRAGITPRFAIITEKPLPPPYVQELQPAHFIKPSDKFDALVQMISLSLAAARPPRPKAAPSPTQTIPAEDSINEFSLNFEGRAGDADGATQVQGSSPNTGLSLALDSASIVQDFAAPHSPSAPPSALSEMRRLDLGGLAVEVPFETQPIADEVFAQDVFAMVGELGTGVTEASPIPPPDGERTVVQGARGGGLPPPSIVSPEEDMLGDPFSSMDAGGPGFEMGDALSAEMEIPSGPDSFAVTDFPEVEAAGEVSRVTGRPLPGRALPKRQRGSPLATANDRDEDMVSMPEGGTMVQESPTFELGAESPVLPDLDGPPPGFDDSAVPMQSEITNFARLVSTNASAIPDMEAFAAQVGGEAHDSAESYAPPLTAAPGPDEYTLDPAVEGPPDIGEKTLAGAFEQLDISYDDAKPAADDSMHFNVATGGTAVQEAPSAPAPSKPLASPKLKSSFNSSAAPVAGRGQDTNESDSTLGVPSLPSNLPSFEPSASGSESEVLKRYAALKERELRDRESRIEVLTRQMAQFKERLDKSEQERRRVTMQLDDMLSEKRNLIDLRDQQQHHVGKIESHHQENLRALQLRLDNAQFTASKAEKKLGEFKERVRQDIMKIRLRERELANKLELQKRDAEALLAAKDERLLAQKREIDRLEFEIESLKEKMIDETRRAEERAAKLTRAIQSLKMAQGMLSGIEEEVLPNSGEGGGKNSGGEAA